MNKQPKPKAVVDEDLTIIPPPSSATVSYEPRPILYDWKGAPLKRKVGF